MAATILIACDLGPKLQGTLEAGIGFADSLGYAPVLLHVDANPQLFVDGLHNLDPDDLTRMRSRYREEALDALRTAVRGLGRDAHGMEILLRDGRPDVRIFEAAAEVRAELIVVGAEVHGTLEHLLVGRTANRVIRAAPCPVLTAKMAGPWQGLSRVVYATDLEEGDPSPSEHWATLLASRLGATLTLIHVSQLGSDFAAPYVFPPRALDTLRQVLSQRLETARERVVMAAAKYQPGPLAVETHLLFAEDTARTLARAAAQDKADLIVVGTHGRRGLARALIGSVAEGVLRHATTSVLTVRQGER